MVGQKIMRTPLETIEMINGWCNDYMSDGANMLGELEFIRLIQTVTLETMDAQPKQKIGWASESDMLDGM